MMNLLIYHCTGGGCRDFDSCPYVVGYTDTCPNVVFYTDTCPNVVCSAWFNGKTAPK